MKLELSLQEVNTVLTGLGRLPYEAVFELVDKIKNQVVPQMNQTPPPVAESKSFIDVC
jgi:hypothetical protein